MTRSAPEKPLLAPVSAARLAAVVAGVGAAAAAAVGSAVNQRRLGLAYEEHVVDTAYSKVVAIANTQSLPNRRAIIERADLDRQGWRAARAVRPRVSSLGRRVHRKVWEHLPGGSGGADVDAVLQVPARTLQREPSWIRELAKVELQARGTEKNRLALVYAVEGCTRVQLAEAVRRMGWSATTTLLFEAFSTPSDPVYVWTGSDTTFGAVRERLRNG